MTSQHARRYLWSVRVGTILATVSQFRPVKIAARQKLLTQYKRERNLVDVGGFEPPTPCLQSVTERRL